MTKRASIGLACLLGAVAPASADVLWGANGHPLTAYPDITIEQQIDYLKDLGMKSYRVNIPDAGKASMLARLVSEGKKYGITILPVITPSGIDLDKDSPETLYDTSKKLAVALGTQFRSDIRVWELGNELENYAIIKACEKRDDGTIYPCAWGPAGGKDALDYYGPRWVKVSAVLKGLSDGMESVDPKIRKAMGTAGWGHLGAFDRMRKDNIDWDISVWHAYGEDPEWAFETLSKYDKPIWLTEFNNPYGSQRSERQQADGLKNTMQRLQELTATYKLEAAFVYELMDEPYWAPNYEASMGLVRVVAKPGGGWIAGEAKPAYATVREFIRGPRLFSAPKRDCDLAQANDQLTPAEKQVTYAYCLVLGQAPDAVALAKWVEKTGNGKVNVSEMLLAMARSDEFKSRYGVFGLSNTAFVNFLYLLLLDREADPQGLVSYVRELNSGSMTRMSIAVGMVESSEFREKHKGLFTDAAALAGVAQPG